MNPVAANKAEHRTQRAVGGLRSAVVMLSLFAALRDPGRIATAAPATRAATSGSASHVQRQSIPPIAPANGMPTIQAAGGPTRAPERTRVRCSFGTHSAAATVPPTSSAATDMPSSAWASARTAKLGAVALTIDAIASPAAPPTRMRRSDVPRPTVPRRIAAMPAASPRHRPQLARRGGRDVEVVSHLRQHGCQHDQARLGGEQAQKQGDRDGHLDPSPRGEHFGSFHGEIVPSPIPRRNGATMRLQGTGSRTQAHQPKCS
jgi:hypothetical protein